ncbi:uncharacterized protein LOC103104522 isoform X2 [Monodelphis domestica]|uniref:uncharacterized protein LOC103104522 isoform X2 n=1 Tax=Monodelphis domestica TaxID=13616 RepID=UPI0024E26E53|nr:uncharacterized protein LOC103104522 isoform X2 [Monodelphis domestica]
MERRSRIFPKEIAHFPRKGLQNNSSSVLLPCPPHQISPLWEQSHSSRIDQMPHLGYQARDPETSTPPFLRTAERESSPQVFQHLPEESQLPQDDHKTMAVLLPYLHHRGLAKPSPRHKYRASPSVMPFPRSNFRAKKTVLKLTADEQCTVSPPRSPNQADYSLDPDHLALDHSGLDHLPKIFPGYKNRAEAITHLGQKAEVLLYEGDESSPRSAYRPSLDYQTGPTPGPLTTMQQTKASLRHRRHHVRASTLLLGFTKKGDRPVSASSHGLKDRSRATVFKPPDLARVLKESHSDLCPKEIISLLRYANSEYSLTPSLSDQDQSPDQEAEEMQAPTAEDASLIEVEATSLSGDYQTTAAAGLDHGVTPPPSVKLQDLIHWSAPTPASEALPDPNVLFTLQAEQEKMAERMEHQAIIPAAGQDYLGEVEQEIDLD